MSKMILACITCRQDVEVDSNLVNEIVFCPFCSSMIFIASSVTEESGAIPPEISSAAPPIVEPPVQSSAPPVIASEISSAVPPTVEPPVQSSFAPPIISSVPPMPEPPVVSDLAPPVISQVSLFMEGADDTPLCSGGSRAYRSLLALIGVALLLLLSIPIAIFYTGSRKEKKTAPVTPATSVASAVETDSTQSEPATTATSKQPESNESATDTTPVAAGNEDVPDQFDNQPIIDETGDNLFTDSAASTEQADPSTGPSGDNLIDSSEGVPTTPSPAAGLPGRKSPHPDAGNIADSTAEPDNENSPDSDFLTGSDTTQNLRTALSTITGTVKDTPSAEQLLALPIESISLPTGNIISLMNLLSGISGAPIIFDPEQIGLLRPLWNQNFSINQDSSTLKKLLDEGVNKSTMQQREQDGTVILEPQAAREPLSISIDLSDMITSDSKPAEEEKSNPDNDLLFLAQQLTKEDITQLIRLMIPTLSDDPNVIRWQEGTITVQGTPIVLDTTKRLIDQLRTIREISPLSGYSNEMLAPEILAWDKQLSATSAITTVEPIALVELIELLGNRFQLRFLFDDNAMAQVGITRQTRINVRTEESSVTQLLNAVLAPLDLGWVIFGEDLIEISSREKATNYSTIEIHLFAIPGRKEISESELRDLIKQVQDGIPQAVWNTGAIDTPGGAIAVDWSSSCLIVRQNQPVQRQMRDWLVRHLQSLGTPALNDDERKSQEDEP